MLAMLFRLVRMVRTGADFLNHQPLMAGFAVRVGALAPCRLALRHSAAYPGGGAIPGSTINHRYKLVHAAAFPGGARVAGR